MKTFKDNSGREWKLTVNVGTAKQVKDRLGVDLFRLFDTEAERLFSDPCLLVDTLYVLCEKQCKEFTVTEGGNTRPLNDAEFGEAMFGDAIEHAAEALLNEVLDFFPSSRRKILREVVNKSEAAAKIMEAQAIEAIQKLDVTQLLSSTKSQATSE